MELEITDELFAQLKQQPLFKGTVVTGSMVPVIKIGEKIVVDVLSENIKRFDIIVFRAQGKLICHYVWNYNRFITPRLIQTRSMYGSYDHPIHPDEYFGKVVSHRLSWWRKSLIILSTLFKKRC